MCSLQAYAYCGCYYALPADLYDCANIQLEVRPNTPVTSTIQGGAPASSGLLTGAISPTAAPTYGGQSLISFLPHGPSSSSDVSSPGFTSASTTSYPVPCGTEGGVGCYTPSSLSNTVSSTSTSSLSFDTHELTVTTPPRPSGIQITSTVTSVISTTGVTTITSCPASLSPCTSPYSSVSAYTTQYTTTLYSCAGGCTPPPMPTTTPVLQPGGQVTTTSLSTTVVTKTSTITSCAPTMTNCPANLPATSTYTEAETKTVLSCDGGCTGPVPAGAKDVCIRRVKKRTIVLEGLLG